jgi:hypothetical protein
MASGIAMQFPFHSKKICQKPSNHGAAQIGSLSSLNDCNFAIPDAHCGMIDFGE